MALLYCIIHFPAVLCENRLPCVSSSTNQTPFFLPDSDNRVHEASWTLIISLFTHCDNYWLLPLIITTHYCYFKETQTLLFTIYCYLYTSVSLFLWITRSSAWLLKIKKHGYTLGRTITPKVTVTRQPLKDEEMRLESGWLGDGGGSRFGSRGKMKGIFHSLTSKHTHIHTHTSLSEEHYLQQTAISSCQMLALSKWKFVHWKWEGCVCVCICVPILFWLVVLVQSHASRSLLCLCENCWCSVSSCMTSCHRLAWAEDLFGAAFLWLMQRITEDWQLCLWGQ